MKFDTKKPTETETQENVINIRQLMKDTNMMIQIGTRMLSTIANLNGGHSSMLLAILLVLTLYEHAFEDIYKFSLEI